MPDPDLEIHVHARSATADEVAAAVAAIQGFLEASEPVLPRPRSIWAEAGRVESCRRSPDPARLARGWRAY